MLVFRSVWISLLATAAAALGIAHAASAANFDPANTTHTLTSTNLGFTALGAGASCTTADFVVDVSANGATATVTTASFGHCTGTGIAAGQTAEVTTTSFPWTITTTGIAGQITVDGIHITENFTAIGWTVALEGSLTGSFNNLTHVATFTNAGDLTATGGALGNGTATVNGTFVDDQGTLAVT
jgi:hypothetical protein